MIEKIVDIRVLSSLDGFISSDLTELKFIDFDSEPDFEGGFGNIYTIKQSNLESPDKLLLKIFHDQEKAKHGIESIKGLHDKLKRREKNTSVHCLNESPELIGLPFIVLKGYNEISQENITGLIVLDLNDIKYLDFGLDDTDHPYTEIELEERFIYAYQLARVVKYLEDLKFVHSDLKEDAIWINTETKQLALIDYDSGYHHDIQLKPSTIGALNQWASKQWRRLIKNQSLNDEIKTRDRISNEHWVLANALFQILYTTVPYFFLKDANPETKEEYLENNSWPSIKMEDPLVKQELQESYAGIIEIFENINQFLGKELFETFKQVFNDGYTKITKRPSPSTWQKILAKINTKIGNEPEIEGLHSNVSEIASEFDEVVVSFSFSNFSRARINNQQVRFRDKNVVTNLGEDGLISLTLENDYGRVQRQIKLNVLKKEPKILVFNASENERKTLEPIILAWETENCFKAEILQTSDKDLLSNDSISVYPKKPTEYELIAYGSFGQKTSTKLSIDVPNPRITDFKYEINIEKGIHNIDISWITENTTHCEVTPFIGKENIEGTRSVDIYEQTKFKLTAYSYFGETTRELNTAPFPKPVIEKLLIPSPKIQLAAKFESTPLQFELNNSIEFKSPSNRFEYLLVEPTPITEPVQLEPFVELNNSFEATSIRELNQSWFNKAYNFVKQKLQKNEETD